MTPREVGERDGIEAARTALAMFQRIAVKWAEAQLSAIARAEPTSDYARGYQAGYRATLEGYLATQA